jgi:hypothetical protein
MHYIAHRGLFKGPDKELENHPDQIDLALSNHYDCEVDLWYVDGKLWLGHDKPTYEIEQDYLEKRQWHLWIHAKNLAALHWLSNTPYNYFWHQTDDFTLTSFGYIWTYPGKELSKFSISVMPEWELMHSELKTYSPDCDGICSDFIELIRDK